MIGNSCYDVVLVCIPHRIELKFKLTINIDFYDSTYIYIRELCVGWMIALCARNVCYLMTVHASAQ
jgi:hypothetical protein